jgi:tRNA(Ile)-lysidine synthase
MASSRKSSFSDLESVVADALGSALTPGANLLLGLSGGIDSVVLLDVLAALAPEMRFSLRALHVNHGISPNAARWAAFCEAMCHARGIPCSVERVDISPYRALGVEGAARQARYEALARHAADFVVLAQHRDDQAETVLLQLARGAGVRGLAGMPQARALSGTGVQVLRPLLSVPRRAIEAHAQKHGLRWIEDESNSNVELRRNFIRARVLPLMEEKLPAVRSAITRTAANLADASVLLDQLAEIDLAAVAVEDALRVRGLTELGAARAGNALRRWCELRGAPWPGRALIAEVLRQARTAGAAAGVAVSFRGWVFRRYRGLLYLDRQAGETFQAADETWRGDPAVPLLGFGGVLRFKPEEGRGLSSAQLRSRPVVFRLRRGGERLQPDCGRPRKTLKNLFQESGTPPWRRDRVPLVYCGVELVCVPGLGEDCRWRARAGEPGLIVSWEPFR